MNISPAIVLAVLAALAFGRSVPRAQGPLPQAPANWQDSGEIHAFHVQGNVHLLVGAGGSVVVQAGDEGILVVDTGLAEHGTKLLTAIQQLSGKPIRYIINTHVHPDHTGGNEAIGKAGRTTQGGPTAILAHANVLTRMSGPGGNTASAAWPTSTYVPGEKDFFFNGEAVMLYHDPAAHTDGDTIVFFRRSDVVVAGDIFITTGYPRIDRQTGGSVNGVLNGLNRILDLTVPKHEQEGGTYVVPGHGRIGDEADVLEYRDMVTIVRDRIEDMAKRGLTLDQVKAATPTLDYDRLYGSTAGPWTTATFIEAIYADVSKRAPARPAAPARGAPAGRR